MEARLLVRDAFPMDDRALLELPSRETFSCYGLHQRCRRIEASLHRHPEYEGDVPARLRLDSRATQDSIWIAPPPAGSIWLVRRRQSHR